MIERAAHKSTFTKGGVSCAVESFVGAKSSVHQMKLCDNNSALQESVKQ
jgi:hypothetical protein